MGRSISSTASRRTCAGRCSGSWCPAATARTWMRRPRSCTGSPSSSARDDDGLRLGVEVERLLPVLLAVPAGLPAAERQLVVDLRPRVDPRVAGLDPLG